MPAIGSASMITRVLTYHDHINPNVASYRERTRRNLQNAVSFLWNYANWQFKWGVEGITFSTDGEAAMPTRFLTFGKAGGVVIEGERLPLRWVPQHAFIRMKAARAGTAGLPVAYTELDNAGSERIIGCVPSPPTSTDADAYFVANSPTITDADPGGLGTAGDTIPVEWQESTLYELLVWYQMKDKGNLQARTDQWELVQRLLRQMVNEERGGRPESHRVVPFNPYHARR